ncbi:MAG: hypothetical protein MIN69_22140 [Methylorubrum extorquens]|uniref:hypothetical protein n=1 Tax=Methylobacteriaceae TaxID=119045 RepID=UPI0019D052A6|nr:hypothetical protein [Methylobacterium organophilum]MBN6824112.1 hypothetical protein [Methylobacterium organophilum]
MMFVTLSVIDQTPLEKAGIGVCLADLGPLHDQCPEGEGYPGNPIGLRDVEGHFDPLRREAFRPDTGRGALPKRRIDGFSEDDATGHVAGPVISTGLAAAIGPLG